MGDIIESKVMQCIVMYAAGNFSCLKSFLKCKFLILDTYHRDILYLHEQGVRIRGYSLRAKGVCDQKRLGNAGFARGCALFRLLLLSV